MVVASVAAPVTAIATVAVAVTAVAGAGSVAMGLFDAGEAVTGKNQLKEAYGEQNYELLEFGFTAVASMGTDFIVNNPLLFSDYSYDDSLSGYNYCKDDFDDNNVEIQKAVDFTDDAKQRIERLDHSNGVTKSNHVEGIKIHQGYKADGSSGKEFKIKGCRIDYYDKDTNTIYELKPNNPASISRGIIQLKRYNEIIGRNSRMILEVY